MSNLRWTHFRSQMAEITHGDVLQIDLCQESENLGFLHFMSKDLGVGATPKDI